MKKLLLFIVLFSGVVFMNAQCPTSPAAKAAFGGSAICNDPNTTCLDLGGTTGAQTLNFDQNNAKTHYIYSSTGAAGTWTGQFASNNEGVYNGDDFYLCDDITWTNTSYELYPKGTASNVYLEGNATLSRVNTQGTTTISNSGTLILGVSSGNGMNISSGSEIINLSLGDIQMNNSKLNLNNGSLLHNDGTMSAKTFENNEASHGGVVNDGTMTVEIAFYNHGPFENNGTVAVTSSCSGASTSCGFYVGNKGATGFENNGTVDAEDVRLEGSYVGNGIINASDDFHKVGSTALTSGTYNVDGDVVIQSDGNTTGVTFVVGGSFTNSGNGNIIGNTFQIGGTLSATGGGGFTSGTFDVGNTAGQCNKFGSGVVFYQANNTGLTSPDRNYQPSICNGSNPTFAGDIGIALPVELTSFEYLHQDGEATFFWATAEEIDASHFEVQMSIDGVNYQTIESIEALNQNNSFYQSEEHVLEASAYFRLKMIDIDGAFTVSSSVYINIKPSFIVEVFPNPIALDGNLSIEVPTSDRVVVNILTLSGETVFSSALGGKSFYVIPHNFDAMGIYIVEVIYEDTVVVKQFSVL